MFEWYSRIPIVDIAQSAVVRRSHDSLDDDSPAEEALEQGTLAFDSLPKETAWQRAPRPTPTTNNGLSNSRVLQFEIISARVVPASEQSRRHILYTLSVRQDSTQTKDPHPAEIERRYTHFRALYLGLKKLYPDLLNDISFPKKVILGNFCADLMSQRSTGFESLLDRVACDSRLREARPMLVFLLGTHKLTFVNRTSIMEAQTQNDRVVIPVLENQFRLLNKIYMDRSRPVLLALLLLVEACTSVSDTHSGGGGGGGAPLGGVGGPHPRAKHWADLALQRFEGVSDADLLQAYIPLLKTCLHLWWQKGQDRSAIESRLREMSQRGIQVEGGPSLAQILEKTDFTELH